MSDPVTYTAVLPLSRASMEFATDHLEARRDRLGTRADRRVLGCFDQAVLALGWLLDGTRVAQLAVDNATSLSTAYRYVHEVVAVLVDHTPSLHDALVAARAAGHRHVMIDATLIPTDRCRAIGPTAGVDLGIPPLAGEGGRARPTTAATSRSSPPPTAGRSAPARCVPLASTTPLRDEPTAAC